MPSTDYVKQYKQVYGEGSLNSVSEASLRILGKHGFFIHCVLPDAGSNDASNFHTHGLESSYGHPDLQVYGGFPPEAIHPLLSNLVQRIAEDGERFELGLNPKVVQGACVRFIEAYETDRDVLRMVLPDAKGRVERDEMDGPFRVQYDNTGKPVVGRSLQ